jgi:hypothetical protein
LPTAALRPHLPPHHRTATPFVAQPPPPPPGSLVPPTGLFRLEVRTSPPFQRPQMADHTN